MNLSELRETLERSLQGDQNLKTLKRARERQSALKRFQTTDDVLRFLNLPHHELLKVKRWGVTQEQIQSERSAVTAALIGEAQRRESALWTTLLILAYFPALLCLRGAVRASASLSAEELNALVVECFLETVQGLPLETQGRLAVVNLTLGTRKCVWRHLAQEAARAAREVSLPWDLDELMGSDSESPEAIVLKDEIERARRSEAVLKLVLELMSEESEADQQLVLNSHRSDLTLIEWVRQQRPELSEEELGREYERLRRRRSRVIRRLRQRISAEHLSHEELGLALLLRD